MVQKVGRNDPCSCGSGKKYKQCCIKKPSSGLGRKFKATVLSSKPSEKEQEQPHMPGPDLIERTFGTAKQPDQEANTQNS